jgi:hypothetical protein
MAKFRILSLDGGGSWALIQAMALIDLYGGSATGHEVLHDFDLAAANSGGSIVLGCLVEDMKLSEILVFFLSLKKRKTIFVEKLHLWYTPKYVAVDKLKGLVAALPVRGRWFLPDAARDIVSSSTGKPVHLLITSFEFDRCRGRFFRSAPAKGPSWGGGDPAQVQLAEAIHASTNAPVLYFDKPAELLSEQGKRYWDGGVSGCNNPVLAAVAEAVVLGNKPEDIVALSIGTGTVALPPARPGAAPADYFASPAKQGILPDIERMAGSILDDPPDAASFLAHVLTGGPPGLPKPVDSRVVRMSPMISPVQDATGTWSPPKGLEDPAFKKVAGLTMDAVAQDEVDAIQNLASLWLQSIVRNQPIRMGADLKSEVGQDFYRDAKAAWLAVR